MIIYLLDAVLLVHRRWVWWQVHLPPTRHSQNPYALKWFSRPRQPSGQYITSCRKRLILLLLYVLPVEILWARREQEWQWEVWSSDLCSSSGSKVSHVCSRFGPPGQCCHSGQSHARFRFRWSEQLLLLCHELRPEHYRHRLGPCVAMRAENKRLKNWDLYIDRVPYFHQ